MHSRWAVLLVLFSGLLLLPTGAPPWFGHDQQGLRSGAGVAWADSAPVATLDALGQADAALTALLELVESTPYPSSSQVQAVLNQFESALALDSRIAPGNFGWALTRLLLLEADASERFGESLVTGGGGGIASGRLFIWGSLLEKARLKGILSPGSKSSLVTSLLAGQLPVGEVDAIQSYLVATALPALEAVKDHLDTALLDTAHIPFAVRDPSGAVILLIDKGDLYLAKAAASVLTASVYLTVVYHLDPGTFDPVAVLGCCSTIYSDGIVTPGEYLPASPFMTRFSQNYWTSMLASLGEAVPAVQNGVVAANHSGGALDPVNPNDPATAETFVELSQYAAILQLGLLGPVQVPVSTSTGEVLVRVDITAWKTRLPTNLKTLFPTFTSSWQIVSVPDRSFAGLFPDSDYPLPELGEGLAGFVEGIFGVPLGESGPETSPPWVGVWSPWEGDLVRGTVHVEGDAGDDHCLQDVRIYVDGALAATLPACMSWFSYEWSWNTTSLSDGSHSLTVYARDRATPANVTSTTVHVVVDNTPPTVALTSPAAGSKVEGIVPVSATASDTSGVQQVRFQAGTRLLYTDSAAPFGFNWDTRTYPDGPTTLTATAVDWAGGSRDSTININVDNLLFDDVPASSSYLAYITALFRSGIAGGCYYNASTGERRFCPGSTITRAQMAVFIIRAMGESPYANPTPTFGDAPASHWAYGYIEKMYQLRITTGCSSSPMLYCPDSPVTRAQMAVFLCRAAGKSPLNPSTPTFADVPQSASFYGYVERLADPASWGGSAVTSGCATAPRRYCPYSPNTREQMAVFVVRAFGISLP